MRYYKIVIDGGPTFDATGDPNALHIELDLPVSAQHDPISFGSVRIWGIQLPTVSQQTQLNGKGIKIYGGMQQGLPLANPNQSGLLVQGLILQAFGNWIGVNQTLDIIIQAGGVSTETETAATVAVKNLSFVWAKGQQMSVMIQNVLNIAYPGYTVNLNISQNLVPTEDTPFYYGDLNSFATYVNETSKAIIGGTYNGVSIVLNAMTFNVFDNLATQAANTTAANPKAFSFTDLIGQPTWIAPAIIQASTVMRGDLAVGDFVTFPPGLVTTTAASQSQWRIKSAFQGTFQIMTTRHVGSYRQPSADAWITTFDMYPTANVGTSN